MSHTSSASTASDPVAKAGDPSPGPAGPPLCQADTDWLAHRLRLFGPAAAVAALATAARGAGLIPWTLDPIRLEEDLFHQLMAPPPPQRRRLSVVGARALARQLAEASLARHAAALARVGVSTACPFDLHVLLPVPDPVLALGSDDPAALRWLWQHWGTTQALRHVALEPPPRRRVPLPAGTAELRLRFWAADWSPWRAISTLRQGWPAVQWQLQPLYDLT